MNDVYQDANSRSPFHIMFGGGVIKVSTDDTAGSWEVIINQWCQQVSN